jgi:gluconolactonase
VTAAFPPEERVVPTVRSLDDLRRVTSVRVDHTEDVRWHEGTVWAGTEGGRLLRIDLDTGLPEVRAETGGFFLGIAPAGDGDWFACEIREHRLLRIHPDGTSEPEIALVGGRRMWFPNYPLVDHHGNLWLTVSGEYFDRDDGYVLRMPPGGEPEVVITDSPRWTNGLALSPDGGMLYVVESSAPSVAAYDISGGGIGPRREVVRFPEGHFPDGAGCDAEGNLFVACWRPDRVYRISPAGSVDVYLDDPTALRLQGPTNVCFGGPDGRRMFVGMNAGRAVVAIDLEAPGAGSDGDPASG